RKMKLRIKEIKQSLKMDYKDQLLTPEWRKKREHILNSRGWKCEKCGSSINLHVHHSFYISGKMAWEYEDYQLNVLCKWCHCKIHGNHDKISDKTNSEKQKDKMFSLCLGYTKVSKHVLSSDISANSKFIYTAICYATNINVKNITYKYLYETFDIHERSISDSIKELESIGAISCGRCGIKKANKYFVNNNDCGYVCIPNCIILSNKINRVEKQFIISNYDFILNITKPISLHCFQKNSTNNSFKRSFTYSFLGKVANRDYFNWLIKDENGILFNGDAVLQLDTSTMEHIVKSRKSKKL
ncbi:MAG: hypothetical protein ACRCTZ_14610, partial [Sarcina sp.]